MRISFLPFLFLTIAFIGCDPYKQEPPAHLIPLDSLTMVYKDLVLSDYKFNIKVDDSIRMLQYSGALNTFRKYGISQARYDSSISYYRLNDDQFEEIIGEVIQELNKEQVTIENRLKNAEKEKLEQSDQ